VFTVKSDDPIAFLAQVPLLPPIATIAWWFISSFIKKLGKIFAFGGLGVKQHRSWTPSKIDFTR
jgi:hypothetical protein